MNEKMLEEINLIRKIKPRLKDFNFMSNNEKSVFLRALESYEVYLKNYIQIINNNIKMMNDEGIEISEKMVIVPIDPNNYNYEMYRNVGILDSLDTRIEYINNIYQNISSDKIDFKVSKAEESVILKSIREYALELNLLKKQRENNIKYNSNIYDFSEGNLESETVLQSYPNNVLDDMKKSQKQ